MRVNFITFAGTTVRLYWSTLISAYGARLPKDIGLTEGHGGEQHNFA